MADKKSKFCNFSRLFYVSHWILCFPIETGYVFSLILQIWTSADDGCPLFLQVTQIFATSILQVDHLQNVVAGKESTFCNFSRLFYASHWIPSFPIETGFFGWSIRFGQDEGDRSLLFLQVRQIFATPILQWEIFKLPWPIRTLNSATSIGRILNRKIVFNKELSL